MLGISEMVHLYCVVRSSVCHIYTFIAQKVTILQKKIAKLHQ